jgi:CBS domain-containing protein
MNVGSVCNHNVATVGASSSVAEAAVLMREEHVGDLIIVQHDNGVPVPVGILTDRDIVVGVVAKGVSADSVTAGDAMTTDLLTVSEHDGVEHALREMRRVGVRRVPVVGDRGELIGVLSIDDVVEHLARQLERVAGIIRFEQETEPQTRP